jgi:hypothetical protein
MEFLAFCLFFIILLTFMYFAEKIRPKTIPTNTETPEPVKLVSPEALMLRNAYIRALNGDSKARDWLTKNAFDTDELRGACQGKKQKTGSKQAPAKKTR